MSGNAFSSAVDPERSKFGDIMPGLNALGQGMLQSSSRVALEALSAHDLQGG
ncbi:uncharacterized protein ARMOST_18047 [Armillaria ostoyae]|uniref:Uncharacterized protein n=1 Tax=Armillaria ostoyae TaxID=47428 RepID=A0A284S0P7_ARMOS|nr:uncharacterized protein ARMOST_18047 [Armillaria ostoyae]